MTPDQTTLSARLVQPSNTGESDMQALSAFIAKHRIRMTAERAANNPHMMGDDNWMRAASHWKCIFRGPNKRQMTVYFSQGSAHTGQPAAADVLDCVASDAASVDNASGFEDWCAEYGYDTDSRRAEHTYKACEAQTSKLKSFLGDDAYEALLYNTERQ